MNIDYLKNLMDLLVLTKWSDHKIQREDLLIFKTEDVFDFSRLIQLCRLTFVRKSTLFYTENKGR